MTHTTLILAALTQSSSAEAANTTRDSADAPSAAEVHDGFAHQAPQLVPRPANRGGGGWGIGDGSLVHYHWRFATGETSEVSLAVGFLPTLLLDTDYSIAAAGGGVYLGGSVFFHGERFNGRRWIRDGVALLGGPTVSIVGGDTLVGGRAGIAYMKQIHKERGRMFAWTLGGGVSATAGGYEAVPMVWWGLNWDRQS